jgi:hypothetical protein
MKNKINLIEETNRMRDLFGYKAGKVISEQLQDKQNQPNSPFPAYKPGTNNKVVNDKVTNPVRPDTQPDQSYPNSPFQAYKTKNPVVPPVNPPVVPPVNPPKTVVKPAAPIQTPKQLGNVEGIKNFQEWLNTNNPGWLKGKTIPLDPKRGYGKFGPSTSASWNKLKDIYLKDISSLKSNQRTNYQPDLVTNTPAKGAQIGQTVSTNTDQAGLTSDQQSNLNRIGQQLQTPEQKRAAELAKKYGS